jgi:hypothetical protein
MDDLLQKIVGRVIRRNVLRLGLSTLCALVVVCGNSVLAAEDADYKVAGGLAIYLGVVPAEMTKGHPPGHPEGVMHGGTPTGKNQYHVMAAIFDNASGVRISDAAVVAQVSGLGLSGPKQKLESMEIAGTITYGGFFNLPGRDLYTIRLTISRPNNALVLVDFKYDHRR